jgi:hypothetical protein
MLYKWYLKERETQHVWMNFQRRWLNYKKKWNLRKEKKYSVCLIHITTHYYTSHIPNAFELSMTSNLYLASCQWFCVADFFSSLKHLMEINYLYYWLRKTLYIHIFVPPLLCVLKWWSTREFCASMILLFSIHIYMHSTKRCQTLDDNTSLFKWDFS